MKMDNIKLVNQKILFISRRFYPEVIWGGEISALVQDKFTHEVIGKGYIDIYQKCKGDSNVGK